MARPRQVSDDEILAAARDCFVELGPGVPTSVIADRLGISQPALFKRYGTKHELLAAALLPPEIPPFVPRIEAGPDGRPVRDQLVEHATAIVAFFEEFAPRMSTLRASGCDVHALLGRYAEPPPLRALRALTGFFAALAAEGRICRACEPTTAALSLLGALQGRAFLSHVLGAPVGVDADQYPSSVIELFWRGIAPEEPS